MKHLITLLLAISLPAVAANTSTSNVQNPFNTRGKVAKRAPAPSGSCDNLPRTCKEMRSCAQAQQAYRCGNKRLDRDKDGIPCDNLCQ